MPTIGCGHWNGRRNRLPHLLEQSFGEVGGAGGFACRWKLISIAHPNPENGYAPYNLSQWACGPQKCDENQASLPNEDFALVVTKSRACPTPTVGAGHSRRCVSLLDIKGSEFSTVPHMAASRKRHP